MTSEIYWYDGLPALRSRFGRIDEKLRFQIHGIAYKNDRYGARLIISTSISRNIWVEVVNGEFSTTFDSKEDGQRACEKFWNNIGRDLVARLEGE